MISVIAISREFGSGGHTIGLALSKELKVPFYDSESIHRIAVEKGYIPPEEKTNSGDNPFLDIPMAGSIFFMNPQDDRYDAESRVIEECAKNSACVIVGRCADHVLREAKIPFLSVLIHADMEYRISHILERYGDIKTVGIESRIKKKDKQRKTYYKYYTDRSWGDFSNYDISLNTASFDEERCVEIISDCARRL